MSIREGDKVNAINVNNLTKIYRQKQREPGILKAMRSLLREEYIYKTAVENINFSVGEGEIVGLLGPNGAGKTTVLKILSGILYPTEGNIEVVGHIPCLREDEFKKKVSLIAGQKSQMLWDLPAIDTLLWLKEIYDIKKETFRETIEKLVCIFEAKDLLNLQVRRMSLGQRMKMELIASMIHNPEVVFLDEPTIGLDIVAQKKLRKFVREYNCQTGATIILTSHNLSDVEELCQKVILINNGKITFDDTLSRLVKKYCSYKIIILEGVKGNLNESDFPCGVKIVSTQKDKIVMHVDLEISQEIIRYIWANYTFVNFQIEDVGIDSIIEQAYEDKSRCDVL